MPSGCYHQPPDFERIPVTVFQDFLNQVLDVASFFVGGDDDREEWRMIHGWLSKVTDDFQFLDVVKCLKPAFVCEVHITLFTNHQVI